MTAIDRMIYRRMKRNYATIELIEAYTPTEEERSFVSTMTRTAQNQLNLMRLRPSSFLVWAISQHRVRFPLHLFLPFDELSPTLRA